MGTFGSTVWGGVGGPDGSTTNIGVPLSSIIGRAYRIAGITKWVGTTPQADWFTEAVSELNALIGGLNNSRLNIFTSLISVFPIGGGQKVFTIGPGADFDMPRPQKIDRGVILLSASTAGAVRMPPMYQMNDEEWANISLQDIPNGIPLSFYYDGSYDPQTGWGNVYLWTQTVQSYLIELYTWQPIPTFQTKDDQVTLPQGYEDMLVYTLAERLEALNPHQSKMLPASHLIAQKARAAVQHNNMPQPKLFISDAANVGNSRGSGRWDYRFGGFQW